MSSQNKEKAEKIEKIYQEYIGKIEELRKKQNQVINNFIKKMEEAKMEELRSKLGK